MSITGKLDKNISIPKNVCHFGTSLLGWWLRLHDSTLGAWVQSLVRTTDPIGTCCDWMHPNTY